MINFLLKAETIIVFVLVILVLWFSSDILATKKSTSTQSLDEIISSESNIDMPVMEITEKSTNEIADEEIEELDYETIVTKSDEMEIGEKETKVEGKKGYIKTKYIITEFEGEVISKEVASVEKVEPINEEIIEGTKVVLKYLQTADVGEVTYVKKLRVWSTSYDANCLGCTGRTYTGKEVKHGICATDPKVIPLGTAFYVPGYGLCNAQDIGGGVKGNHIDLGFEDVRLGWWSARFVDIYIIP